MHTKLSLNSWKLDFLKSRKICAIWSNFKVLLVKLLQRWCKRSNCCLKFFYSVKKFYFNHFSPLTDLKNEALLSNLFNEAFSAPSFNWTGNLLLTSEFSSLLKFSLAIFSLNSKTLVRISYFTHIWTGPVNYCTGISPAERPLKPSSAKKRIFNRNQGRWRFWCFLLICTFGPCMDMIKTNREQTMKLVPPSIICKKN